MKPILGLLLIILLIGGGSSTDWEEKRVLTDDKLKEKAYELAQKYIIADTHIDTPSRLFKKMEDISIRTEGGDFDHPRAKEGGLNAAFMSIYIPAEYEKQGGARELADKLIHIVEKFASDWPDKFSVAASVADVKAQFAQGRISVPMGMENGAAVEGRLENLKYFYDRGIRYITLTHSKDNHISDSSYDTTRTWRGLSPFGRDVVEEMNRLGIMIDVSHISDDAFYQVMELSRAPVIASHSSCRYFTPGWERNMDDDMIQLLAKNGGVIQINFGSSFVNDDYRIAVEPIREYLEANNLKWDDEAAQEYIKRYREENSIDFADISDVVSNFDHVVQLVGVEYVGLGSDFDGLGDSLPNGLKDVSYYPNLIYELLKNGYSEEDIGKICSENLFRVWSDVERIAHELQSAE